VLGALVLAVLAIAFVLTRGGGHKYRVVFDDAGQLVKGDLVRVGGTKAGIVKSISLTDDGRAEIHITLDDAFSPLRSGTTAIIRAQGLTGVASRYVDVSPAPTFKPKLPDGATIGTDKTESIVEIDQLFDTLDDKTRAGLEQFIRGNADWYAGNEANANLSAKYFSPAISATSKLFSQIDDDSGAFEDLLVNAGKALGAATADRGRLTDLVGHTQQTFAALGSNEQSLTQALDNLPQAMHEGSDAFAALRPALKDLQHLVDVSGTSTKDLAPFLARLRPVLEEATPTFRQFRALFDQPGAHDDLYDALKDLPELGRLTSTTFPNARKSLKDSTPIFEFSRPYTPDLVSWVSNFGAALGPYDANGHYARTVAVFDAFGFQDDAEGGHLVAKSPAGRGVGDNLKTGFLKRCPGAAVPAPADNSANWLDNGPLANPDCDPSQRVGGAK